MRPQQGAALLVALAAAWAAPAWAQSDPRDPWEPFNRKVESFNTAVDDAAVKPLAEGYRKVLPEPVRIGVGNFFGNLVDAWSVVNHLLQGKVVSAAQMTLRVASNTVFGLGGVLDPATEFGLEKQSEDLGQTLGHWGVPPGPYVVLPFLGPANVRDASARPVDVYAIGVGAWGAEPAVAWTTSGLELVHLRSELLSATNLLDDIALDRYAFIRDAYLARRRNLVWDGNPPEEDAGYDDAGDDVPVDAPAEPASAASSVSAAPVAPAAEPASAASAPQ